ncbi:MAG: hypothetical protein WD669_04180 [Pirellulales bacterium]
MKQFFWRICACFTWAVLLATASARGQVDLHTWNAPFVLFDAFVPLAFPTDDPVNVAIALTPVDLAFPPVSINLGPFTTATSGAGMSFLDLLSPQDVARADAYLTDPNRPLVDLSLSLDGFNGIVASNSSQWPGTIPGSSKPIPAMASLYDWRLLLGQRDVIQVSSTEKRVSFAARVFTTISVPEPASVVIVISACAPFVCGRRRRQSCAGRM